MVKKKTEAFRAEEMEPLNPGVVLWTNQEEREYVTSADHSTTLSISATNFVVMASVGTTYRAMHQLHVVLETGS